MIYKTIISNSVARWILYYHSNTNTKAVNLLELASLLCDQIGQQRGAVNHTEQADSNNEREIFYY
jgi:hypothetical protein